MGCYPYAQSYCYAQQYPVNIRSKPIVSMLIVIILFCISLLVYSNKEKWLGITLVHITSESMQPVLKVGDIVLVDIQAYEKQPPQLNDIVLFTRNNISGYTVKRITPTPKYFDNSPKDKLFVMGDNRQDSFDSRYYGLIEASQVKGKAVFVIMSIKHWRRIALIL